MTYVDCRTQFSFAHELSIFINYIVLISRGAALLIWKEIAWLLHRSISVLFLGLDFLSVGRRTHREKKAKKQRWSGRHRPLLAILLAVSGHLLSPLVFPLLNVNSRGRNISLISHRCSSSHPSVEDGSSPSGHSLLVTASTLSRATQALDSAEMLEREAPAHVRRLGMRF